MASARIEPAKAASVLDPLALKRWRKSLNYSQAELGWHLGVSSWTISNWETSKHRIPRTVPVAMAKLRRHETVVIARNPDHATPDWKRKLYGY